jgi:hypothetical protein
MPSDRSPEREIYPLSQNTKVKKGSEDSGITDNFIEEF